MAKSNICPFSGRSLLRAWHLFYGICFAWAANLPDDSFDDGRGVEH
jgi:hypothetical protein